MQPVINSDSLYLILAILLTVPVFAALFFFVLHRKHRTHILLLGVSESGKTTLFTQLILPKESKLHESGKSCISIHENVADLVTQNQKIFKLVDLPGHDKVRQLTLDRYKAHARGIIFLVDSGNIHNNVRDVAEFLFRVMTDPSLGRSGIPLIIVCNKQDLPTAKGLAVIRGMLEKELNILRQTKAGQLTSLEEKNSKRNASLGKEGEPFNFDAYRGMKIRFGESICATEGNNNLDSDQKVNLDEIHEWLNAV